MKLEGVAVTHVLVVGEDSTLELGIVVVASDVYAIRDVRPGVAEESEIRLDPCEET